MWSLYFILAPNFLVPSIYADTCNDSFFADERYLEDIFSLSLKTPLFLIETLAFCSAGGTQRLPRLVGKSIAKELIFTGRKIGSSDALSMGMLQENLVNVGS